MANIKPSEISSILLMQLQNMSNKVQFEEIGKVLQVSDGVAHVYGLDKVQSNELVEFENGTMGVVLNLEEDNVGVVLLGPTEGMPASLPVKECWGVLSTVSANLSTARAPSKARPTRCRWNARLLVSSSANP